MGSGDAGAGLPELAACLGTGLLALAGRFWRREWRIERRLGGSGVSSVGRSFVHGGCESAGAVPGDPNQHNRDTDQSQQRMRKQTRCHEFTEDHPTVECAFQQRMRQKLPMPEQGKSARDANRLVSAEFPGSLAGITRYNR